MLSDQTCAVSRIFFLLCKKGRIFLLVSAQFQSDLSSVSRVPVLSVNPAMSLRKLCSQVASNSATIFRRQHFTNSKALCPILKVEDAIRVSHTANYSQALGSLTKDQAHDLVFRMNDEERTILMRTLEQFNVIQEKTGLECECLARSAAVIVVFY